MWPFKSSDDRLKEQARGRATALVDCLDQWQPEFLALLDNPQRTVDRSASRLRWELPVLCLFLVDRFAFDDLGPSGRDVFMDALLDTMAALYGQRLGEEATGHLIELFNERIHQYTTYKVLGERPTDLRGTLCWEFAKAVTMQYWGGPNPVVVGQVTAFAMDTMIRLQKAGILRLGSDASRRTESARDEGMVPLPSAELTAEEQRECQEFITSIVHLDGGAYYAPAPVAESFRHNMTALCLTWAG